MARFQISPRFYLGCLVHTEATEFVAIELEKELPALFSKMHRCIAVPFPPSSSSSRSWCVLMLPRLCLNLIIYNHPDEGIKPYIAPVTGQLQALLWGHPLALLPQHWVHHRSPQGTALGTPHTAGHSCRVLPSFLGWYIWSLDLWGSQSRGLLKCGKEHPC